jgi:hypothetical protein
MIRDDLSLFTFHCVIELHEFKQFSNVNRPLLKIKVEGKMFYTIFLNTINIFT